MYVHVHVHVHVHTCTSEEYMNEWVSLKCICYSYDEVHEYCYTQCMYCTCTVCTVLKTVYGITHVDRPLPGAIVSFRLKAKWRLIGRRTRGVGLGVVPGRGQRLLGLGGSGRRRYVLEHDLSGETSGGGVTWQGEDVEAGLYDAVQFLGNVLESITLWCMYMYMYVHYLEVCMHENSVVLLPITNLI